MRRYIIFISVLFFLAVYPDHSCQANYPEKVDSLLRLVNSQENNTEKVENLLALSLEFSRLNREDSALLFAEQAYTQSKALEYNEGRADALYRKSLIYSHLGEQKDALFAARQCLYICDSLKDSMRIAKANYNMGNLKRISSYTKSALGYYKTALNIYLPKQDTARIISVYNSLGNYFQNISAYDSSSIYYHKALTLSELIGKEQYQGIILNNLGKISRLQHSYENSRKYLVLGREINVKYNKTHLANTITELGILAFDEGNMIVAMDYILLADSIYRKIDDAGGVHNSYINIAAIYRVQGKFSKAFKNLSLALNYCREHDYADGMIAVWQSMATLYSIDDIKTALIYNDSCLTLAVQTNNLQRQKQILQDIFEIQYNQADYEKAVSAHIRLKEVEDSIYNLESVEIINELNFQYENKKYQLKIFNLEKKNLLLEYQTLQRKKQHNAFIYTGLGIILLVVYLLVFFRYRARKNQVIAEQKISRLEDEKKLLAARFLVEGEEKERKRIATAIHDSLGVLLSTSKMHITAIKDDNPENRILIDKATKFLDEASGEMRKISHNMMPGLLSKLGLCEALEDLFETLNEVDGIEASMEVVGPKERLPENKEIMIYRVVQEMVNNTIKHAKAQNINLTLIVHPDQLDLSYADDGRGFVVKEVLGQKTMGVQSIRSRVKFLDGNINIDSSPGKGTVYRISIPLSPEKTMTSV